MQKEVILSILLTLIVLSSGCIFDNENNINTHSNDTGKVVIPNNTYNNNSNTITIPDTNNNIDVKGNVVLSPQFSYLNKFTNNTIYIRVSNGQVQIWDGKAYRSYKLYDKRNFFKYFSFLFVANKSGEINVKITELLTGEVYYLTMTTEEFFGVTPLSPKNNNIYMDFVNKFYGKMNTVPYGVYDITISGEYSTYLLRIQVASGSIPSYYSENKINILRDQQSLLWRTIELPQKISTIYGITMDSGSYMMAYNRLIYISRVNYYVKNNTILQSNPEVVSIFYLIPDNIVSKVYIVNNTPDYDVNIVTSLDDIDFNKLTNSTIYIILNDGTIRAIEVSGYITNEQLYGNKIVKNVEIKFWTPSKIIKLLTTKRTLPQGNTTIYRVVYTYGKIPKSYYNITGQTLAYTIYPSKLYLSSNTTHITRYSLLSDYQLYSIIYNYKDNVSVVSLYTINNLYVPYINNNFVSMRRLLNDDGRGALFVIVVNSSEPIPLYYLDNTGKFGVDYGENVSLSSFYELIES